MLKSISIENYAGISNPIFIELGKITYIQGDNDMGKTSIAEAIELLFDYSIPYDRSICRLRGKKTLLSGSLEDANNKAILVKRIIERENNIIYRDSLMIDDMPSNDYKGINSKFSVLLHKAYSTIFENDSKLAAYCIKSLTGWAVNLKIHHYKILNELTNFINNNTERLIEHIYWDENHRLKVKLWESEYELYYDTISGGEKNTVCAEIFISLSQMFCSQRNALVIFDDLPTRIVGDFMHRVYSRIEKIIQPNIQFIFTSIKEEDKNIFNCDKYIELTKEDNVTKIKKMLSRRPKEILEIENKIITQFNSKEDEFINTLIIPLLRNMGFRTTKRVSSHGPGELGLDIGPLLGKGFEWRDIIIGAQVKACKLTGNSSSSSSIIALIDEIKKALYNSFYLDELNIVTNVDYVMAIVSQYPTNDAIMTFNHAFNNERRVLLITPSKLAELIWKYNVKI